MLKLYTFEKLEMSFFHLQDSQVEQSQAKPLKYLINEPYKHNNKKKSQSPCYQLKEFAHIIVTKALMYKHYLQMCKTDKKTFTTSVCLSSIKYRNKCIKPDTEPGIAHEKKKEKISRGIWGRATPNPSKF